MLGWNNPLPIGQSSAAPCGGLGGTYAWLRRGHSSLRTDGRATSIYRTTISPELRTSMLATTRILVSKLATARVFCSLPHKFFVPYNLASISCSLELTFFGHPLAHRHACLYLSDSSFWLSSRFREKIVTTSGKARTLRSAWIWDFLEVKPLAIT